MVEGVKRCPVCTAQLHSVPKLGLLTFECPQGHGVGINILNESRNLQRDELEAIFRALDDAPLSELLSPITGKPMATVTFLADDDLEIGNVGPDAKYMTIEVDVDNYFGWFSFEELRDMPLNITRHTTGSSAGFVGADALGSRDGVYDKVFKDYEYRSAAEEPIGGLFSGIARRIHG